MPPRELKIGASGVRGVVGDALTPELIVATIFVALVTCALAAMTSVKRVWHLEPSLTDPDTVYAGVEGEGVEGITIGCSARER